MIGETLLAREGVWQLPVLLGSRPYAATAADGSLLTTPGYDPQTQLAVQAGRRGLSRRSPTARQGGRTAGAGDGQAGDRHVSLHRRGGSLGGALAAADGRLPADARLRAPARDHRAGGRDRQVASDRSDLDPADRAAGAGALGRDRRRRIREAARRLADGRRSGDLVRQLHQAAGPRAAVPGADADRGSICGCSAFRRTAT